jgi:glycosyltransferase involved in cell wall biosynthesis
MALPPKVSVIMPTYRGAKFIEEAISSILDQTYRDFELIIIHQPSEDGTLEIIEKLDDERIKVRTRQVPGHAPAHNMGFDLARGEYIAVMDDDDIAIPSRLEQEVAYLNGNKDIDAVCSTFMYIDEEGNRLLDEPVGVYHGSLPPFEYVYTVGNFIPTDSAMFRRTDLRYDETLPSAIDVKFWLEFLHRSNRIHQFKEPLILARRIGDHASSGYTIQEKLEHRTRIRHQLKREYGLPTSMYLKAISKEYLAAAFDSYGTSKFDVLRYMIVAFFTNPFNRKIYSRVLNKLKQKLGMKSVEIPSIK